MYESLHCGCTGHMLQNERLKMITSFVEEESRANAASHHPLTPHCYGLDNALDIIVGFVLETERISRP